MKALESWLVAYLLNSLWQVPLVFAAACIAARLARAVGARMEHRVWASAIVIATLLPLCNLKMKELWQLTLVFLRSAWTDSTPGGSIRITFSSASTSATGLLRLPPWLSSAMVIVYACTLLYFATRLAWALWRTHRLRHQAQPVATASGLSAKFNRCAERLNFRAGQIAISSAISGPVTVGIRRPTLLIPPGFLQSLRKDDLDTVMAHELAHMQRHDFARNLLYEALGLPLSYHPLFWLIRSRLAQTREMVCDNMAAKATSGQQDYARSLLRLASILSSPAPNRNLHAIGIFDANILERRVMNLTQKRPEMRGRNRLLIAIACAAVALITCVSAIALRVNISEAQAQTDQPRKIHVKSDNLKLVSQVHPIYPPEAKKARIQGAVVLEVVISKEGVPEHIVVQSGPEELRVSALEAVRQWRYEPYLLNGDPVEVETTITVTYELAG